MRTLVPILAASLAAFSGFAVSAAPAAATPVAPERAIAQAQPSPPAEDPKLHALAASLVAQAQRGDVDRSLFDARAGAALTPELVQTQSTKMAPLGKPTSIRLVNKQSVDGTDVLAYRVTFASLKLIELIALDENGKVSGWRFSLDQPPATATATSTPS